MNSRGFHFSFKEPFYDVWISFEDEDSERLHWYPVGGYGWKERQLLNLHRAFDHDPLEYDTEYELMITVQHFDCDSTDIVIQFRTKPQRHVVGAPEPAIQQRIPDVPLGERLRFDIVEPRIVAGDVADGANNVNPELLNANGIQFEFNERIKKYEINLRFKDGASLGWLPRGLVDNEDVGKRIKITPGDGAALLDFNTEYEIELFVRDFFCFPETFQIWFRTKPKP